MPHRIDLSRPVAVTGHVTRDLAKMTYHPFHACAMDLAQERLDPAFLKLADPVEEASIEASAENLHAWLAQSGWGAEFFKDLQCLSQTAAGEPLLTTWLSMNRFSAMLADGKGEPIIDAIANAASRWSALGMDEVFFDFHARQIPSASIEGYRSDELATTELADVLIGNAVTKIFMLEPTT